MSSHVDDLVSAVTLLLDSAEPQSIYHVVDDTPVLMKDFFNETARLLGRRKLRHVPVFVGRLVKGRGPIAAAVRSARSSNQRLRSLGWTPRYPDYRSGLASTVAELGSERGGGGRAGQTA